MVAIVVVARVVVAAAARELLVTAREVLVVEVVVEAELRVKELVAGGGASACGASAGEHAVIKAAATAKAQAERFTTTGFPEDTLSVLGRRGRAGGDGGYG